MDVERGMDSDFCLALLCACLLKRRNQSKNNGNQVSTNSSQVRLPPLRLVLMSATISTEAFQQYLYRQLYPATTSGPGSTVPSVGRYVSLQQLRTETDSYEDNPHMYRLCLTSILLYSCVD